MSDPSGERFIPPVTPSGMSADEAGFVYGPGGELFFMDPETDTVLHPDSLVPAINEAIRQDGADQTELDLREALQKYKGLANVHYVNLLFPEPGASIKVSSDDGRITPGETAVYEYIIKHGATSVDVVQTIQDHPQDRKDM